MVGKRAPAVVLVSGHGAEFDQWKGSTAVTGTVLPEENWQPHGHPCGDGGRCHEGTSNRNTESGGSDVEGTLDQASRPGKGVGVHGRCGSRIGMIIVKKTTIKGGELLTEALTRELLLDSISCGFPHFGSDLWIRDEFKEGVGEGLSIASWDEEPGDFVLDCVDGAGRSSGHHRFGRCGGLEDNGRKTLSVSR